MPELPEVESVRRGLADLIIDKKFCSIKVTNSKSFLAEKEAEKTFLLNSRVTKIRRRAKVLIIDLSTDYSLVIHLKMTGQVVYRGSDQAWGAGHPNDSLIGDLPDRSTRIEFAFCDGSKLFFNDQRKFGWVKLMPTVLVPELPFMQKVGPEPLTDDFNGEVFAERLKRKQRSKIKPTLLDQSVVAGIGNIYADESLLLAKIHPARLVGDLTAEEIFRLAEKIKEVLQKSVDAGGSSSRNYVDAEGKKGNYLSGAYAYKRDGQACRICGDQIVKIKLAGRGTHYCPTCQKL